MSCQLAEVPVVAPDAGCIRAGDAVRARVELDLRKRYKVRSSGHKLVLDAGCDPLVGGAREIVIEGGSGHGGTLVLTQLSRTASMYEVRRLRWSEYHQRGLEIERGSVPAALVDAQLARVRAALLTTMREVEIPLPPGRGLGLSGTGSSDDYHRGITLRDAGGHALERHFSGYASEGLDELPIALAGEALSSALAPIKLATAAADDADRLFFAQRFANMARDPNVFWWVEERFVSMASVLGTRPVLPSLVTVAKKKFAQGSPEERRHRGALVAIGAILGFRAEALSSSTVVRRAELACAR
jgi:hypothetical protein